jgi:hypothetical protein
MKRWFLLSQWGLLAAPLLADGGLLRVGEVRRASYHYDRATGAMTRTADTGLRTYVCWDSSLTSGYFSAFGPDEVALDWGDADTRNCLSAVSGFQIGYASELLNQSLDIDVVFYASDNGFGTVTRSLVAALRLTGLPDGVSPGAFVGWIVDLTVTPPIDLRSEDLDADGLGDFSYTYNMRNVPGDGHAGPLISGDPNVATGAEEAFDFFTRDPNVAVEPNEFLIADVNTTYEGTFWCCNALIQWHLRLSAGDPNFPGCDHPSCVAADIEPPGGDCDVDLSDLAVLLVNFGVTSGATRGDGDVEGADGDVDLSDLAVMLGAFGVDC